MSAIEAISVAASIIEELETLVSEEKDAVEESAEVITWREFSEKSPVVFMISWLSIEADCQKFENKALNNLEVFLILSENDWFVYY